MGGEFAGGFGIAFLGGEEGEVVAADAAVVEGGAAVVTFANEGFACGEVALLDEEGAECAFQRECAGGEIECFADA